MNYMLLLKNGLSLVLDISTVTAFLILCGTEFHSVAATKEKALWP